MAFVRFPFWHSLRAVPWRFLPRKTANGKRKTSQVIEHLYIHIPFCHRICPYCAFYKHPHGNTDFAAFVDAVVKEARMQRERVPMALKTVYFGGGTPTALSETHLDRLLTGLHEVLDLGPLEEFGMEANPMTVTASKAAMLKRQGLSRISLGVQAWDPETLATLGRDHSPAQAEETFLTLREAGFTSLNLDLMFSVPGQSTDAWRHSLEKTLALKPDHVSAYNLNYEEDTAFFEKLARGEYRENPERDAEHFFLALDSLEAQGFRHYEISNYAQPGHESAHNASYWFGKDYLGLGPSAFSTQGLTRWRNMPDTARYIAAIQEGILPKHDAEQLTPAQHHIERVALELRTAKGVSLDRLSNVPERTLNILTSEGLVTLENRQVKLTRQGKLLADSVAGELLG